jgi:hypothetical protein
VLKDERPAMIEVILSALSAEVADATRAELGLKARAGKGGGRDVKPEVLSVIRWKLEDALRQGGPQIGSFRFTDMLMLQQREIFAVADRMGARVLATAIAGLPEAERQTFFEKLPPDQRALAIRAAEAGTSRRLSEHDSKTVLEMYGALENPSDGLRTAGVQRVARACVAQSPEFAQRMVERHHGELGRLLQRWVREERPKQIKGDGGRLDIVEQLERLAQKSIIDRPMRLPPPTRPPPPPAASPPRELVQVPVEAPPPQQRERTSSKVLVPPPARRSSTGQNPVAGAPRHSTGQSPVAGAAPRSGTGMSAAPSAPRSGTGQNPPTTGLPRRPSGEPRSAAEPRPGSPLTDSQLRRRVLRDGKPLVRETNSNQESLETMLPPRRNSSPVQPIPRRREGTASTPGPVIKGPSGRGPGGGSR